MAVATTTDMLVAAETFATVTVIVSLAQLIEDRVGAAIATLDVMTADAKASPRKVFFICCSVGRNLDCSLVSYRSG